MRVDLTRGMHTPRGHWSIAGLALAAFAMGGYVARAPMRAALEAAYASVVSAPPPTPHTNPATTTSDDSPTYRTASTESEPAAQPDSPWERLRRFTTE